MSAVTKWWLCGQCSFANKPRGRFANSLNIGGMPDVHDNEKCEQCGAPRADKDATDYQPIGRL